MSEDLSEKLAEAINIIVAYRHAMSPMDYANANIKAEEFLTAITPKETPHG